LLPVATERRDGGASTVELTRPLALLSTGRPAKCYRYCKNKPYPKSRYCRGVPDSKIRCAANPLHSIRFTTQPVLTERLCPLCVAQQHL
jgi:hypothetical protein